MQEWCFVHAADLHLDTPLQRIRAVDERFHRALVDASLDAFDRLVQLTLDRDAAFLVLAGDVYDGAQRGMRAQLRVLDGARRLEAAGIQLLIAHGNHDPLDGWTAIERWPQNVTVFGPDHPQHVHVERDGRLLAVVTGVSYAQQHEQRNLALRFERTSRAVPHVAVLHANVGSNAEHDPYAPATVDDLVARGFDYWALGHIHRRATLATPADRGCWIHYPGNLQGRSPKATEQGPKGASVVGVRGAVVDEPEFVALDGVRFASPEVDVADVAELDVVTGRLREAAGVALAQADGRLLVLRATLRGAAPVHHDLGRGDVLDELVEALRDTATDGVLWTSVRDGTRPPADPDAVAGAVDEVDAAEVDEAALLAAVTEVAAGLGVELPDAAGVVADARRAVRTLLQETVR